jgi:DNA processing protein
MSTQELSALIQLWHTPGIGSFRLRNLLSRFHSALAVLKAPVRELAQVDGIDQVLAGHIKNNTDDQFAEQQLAALQQQQVRLLTYWDEDYPALLKNCAEPPVLLFVKGSVEVLHKAQLALVGTRHPSSYGRLMAEKFSRELVSEGIVVTSGLARGIDTYAHRAALSAGGLTIAVMASGVDVIYPYENAALAKDICAQGALISEYPMSCKPEASYFPRRNRIIAGLSLGTLVIEAGQGSGALITADNAVQNNREVFAVPGNINNPKSLGCNLLIQQGAKGILTTQDILEELSGFTPRPKTEKPTLLLTEMEEKIIAVLNDQPVHIDAVALQAEVSTQEALAALLALELRGLVLQLAGKQFVLVP